MFGWCDVSYGMLCVCYNCAGFDNISLPTLWHCRSARLIPDVNYTNVSDKLSITNFILHMYATDIALTPYIRECPILLH